MELVHLVKDREPEEVWEWVEEEEVERVPGDFASVLPAAKKFHIRQEFLVLR
jgi:hypothetical protein